MQAWIALACGLGGGGLLTALGSARARAGQWGAVGPW